jgi:OOP family OmpA-OmpF porin
MKIRLASILLLALLAAPALAQESGPYIGASLGQAEHGDTCEGANLSCDEKDSAWKIYGGYQFNRFVAVEFGYADLGRSAAGANVGGIVVNPTFEVTAFELSGIGFLPLLDRLALFMRLGVYRAETELGGTGTAFGITVPISGKESNSDLTFGLGIQYGITRNIGLRGEWQQYMKVGGGDTGETDIDVLSVGLLFRF